MIIFIFYESYGLAGIRGHDITLTQMLEDEEFAEIFNPTGMSEKEFREHYNVKITNTYFRSVKAPEDFDYERMYVECKGHKQGAIASTYFETDKIESLAKFEYEKK